MNLRHLEWLLIMATLPVFAADPAAKIPPPPSQGIVSPSGKFTPIVQATGTNENVPRTPGAVQATLNPPLEIKQTGSNTFQIGFVELDREKRSVRLPAVVCNRDQVIEYALVTTGGKTYESLLSTKASAMAVHLAFLLLGVGEMPAPNLTKQPMPVPESNAVLIEVVWQTNGLTTSVPLAKLICLTDGDSKSSPPPLNFEWWLYNGSLFDQWGFMAQREGSVVALICDPSALINNPGADRDNDLIHRPDTRVLPALGTPVTILMHLSGSAKLSPPVPALGVTPVTPLSTNRN